MKLMQHALLAFALVAALPTQAAVALDRTRVIYTGDSKSQSLNIRNHNKALPYLAQAWMEDAMGRKIASPFVVLPPVQRLEPGADSMLKVQATQASHLLPQDRESLFYFNLREIPPRSDKPNSLQLALQTRIKFFYRPQSLVVEPEAHVAPWQQQLKLTPAQGHYRVDNPTPYYVTLVDAASKADGEGQADFTPLMLAPFGHGELNLGIAKLGKAPTLTYVDDFGGRRPLHFRCNDQHCSLTSADKAA